MGKVLTMRDYQRKATRDNYNKFLSQPFRLRLRWIYDILNKLGNEWYDELETIALSLKTKDDNGYLEFLREVSLNIVAWELGMEADYLNPIDEERMFDETLKVANWCCLFDSRKGGYAQATFHDVHRQITGSSH